MYSWIIYTTFTEIQFCYLNGFITKNDITNVIIKYNFLLEVDLLGHIVGPFYNPLIGFSC